MKKREFKETDFIDGNIDKNVKILKDDATFWNVECTRILINPANPLFPEIRKRVVTFRFCDYDAYFCNGVEKNILYLKAMNFSAASVVWDPTLQDARTKKIIAEVLAAREAVKAGNAELKMKEGKRKATISDLEKLK